jgi:hypothetical protein
VLKTWWVKLPFLGPYQLMMKASIPADFASSICRPIVPASRES